MRLLYLRRLSAKQWTCLDGGLEETIGSAVCDVLGKEEGKRTSNEETTPIPVWDHE
jgi:hypothetical protein